MDLAQVAAIVAALLIAAVAAFQVALALGAPYGEAVFGGKAPTAAGVLTRPFRVLAAAQAVLLALLAWILLARSGAVGIPLLGTGSLIWLTWGIVGFLVLNTVANLSAPHPIERWVMGSVTFVLAGLAMAIALQA